MHLVSVQRLQRSDAHLLPGASRSQVTDLRRRRHLSDVIDQSAMNRQIDMVSEAKSVRPFCRIDRCVNSRLTGAVQRQPNAL